MKAAKRRKNAAHGASRGSVTKKGEAPKGRKTLPHTSANILLHMIFSTQGRLAFIKPEFRDDLFAYLGGIIREMRGTALIVNGTADHVHVLVRIRPAHSAAEIARVIKANSSGWVRAKWASDFAWQTGYGVFSVSESNMPAVTNILPIRKNITKSIRFRKSFWRSSKRTTWCTTRNTFGASFWRPFGACRLLHDYPRLAPWAAFLRRFAAGLTPVAMWLTAWPKYCSISDNSYYERDLVRCRRQQVAFFIMAERSKLEWWFTGSILLLAISVLGFAYLFWESYLVTKR